MSRSPVRTPPISCEPPATTITIPDRVARKPTQNRQVEAHPADRDHAEFTDGHWLLKRWIEILGERTDAEARKALSSLAHNPALDRWYELVSSAREAQA